MQENFVQKSGQNCSQSRRWVCARNEIKQRLGLASSVPSSVRVMHPSVVNELNPQDIANTVWALATLRTTNNKLIDVLPGTPFIGVIVYLQLRMRINISYAYITVIYVKASLYNIDGIYVLDTKAKAVGPEADTAGAGALRPLPVQLPARHQHCLGYGQAWHRPGRLKAFSPIRRKEGKKQAEG